MNDAPLQASRTKFIRDVTHPLTKCNLRRIVDEYIAAGYTLIKEDFLNLAATEGERMNMYSSLLFSSSFFLLFFPLFFSFSPFF